MVSGANLRQLKMRAGLIGEVGEMVPGAGVVGGGVNVHVSIAQQEKEFQKAVQPGSPISALLSSARQPLIVAGGAMGTGATRENPLFRKLANAAREKALEGITEESAPVLNAAKERMIARDRQREKVQGAGRKELESQKARIVAQMVPAQNEDQENVPPIRTEKSKGKEREREIPLERELPVDRESYSCLHPIECL